MLLKTKRKITFDLPSGVEIRRLNSEAEWLEARREYLTASDAAALFGLHRYKSRLGLYAEKTGKQIVDDKDNVEADLGKVLEEPVAQQYMNATRRRLIDLGRFTLIVNHDEPHVAATVDRLIVKPGQPVVIQGETLPPGAGVLECKTAGASQLSDWENGETPAQYRIQLMHQLLATKLTWGSLAVITGGAAFGFQSRDYKADSDFLTLLREKVREFWDAVRDGVPPPADGSKSSQRALKLLYPEDTGETVQLPNALIAVDAKLTELKDRKRTDEKEIDALENQIAQAIGSASFGRLPNGVLYSYLTTKRESYVAPAVKFRVLRRKKRL